MIHLFQYYYDFWSYQGEDLTSTPNFQMLEILSLWIVYAFLDFQMIEPFGWHNP